MAADARRELKQLRIFAPIAGNSEDSLVLHGLSVLIQYKAEQFETPSLGPMQPSQLRTIKLGFPNRYVRRSSIPSRATNLRERTRTLDRKGDRPRSGRDKFNSGAAVFQAKAGRSSAFHCPGRAHPRSRSHTLWISAKRREQSCRDLPRSVCFQSEFAAIVESSDDVIVSKVRIEKRGN